VSYDAASAAAIAATKASAAARDAARATFVAGNSDIAAQIAVSAADAAVSTALAAANACSYRKIDAAYNVANASAPSKSDAAINSDAVNIVVRSVVIASEKAAADYSSHVRVGAEYDVHRNLNLDFKLLVENAKREKWSDESQALTASLGPLWPEGTPSWWDDLAKPPQKSGIPADELPPLTVLIRPGTASPEEIGDLLAEISILYRMFGGSGIAFSLEDLHMPVEEALPV
jgi:hypothetical protein